MGENARESTAAPPNLGSRIVVTWAELTVVGLAGGILGTTVGGPPALVVYFGTTLLSVAILLYNVNELIRQWVTADDPDSRRSDA